MIEFSFADRQALAALNELASRALNPTGVLKAIGEDLIETTKQRFASSTAPDGTEWKPNKASTLVHKSGSKPLIDSGTLENDTLSYHVLDPYTLVIGSSSKYAAMQQFGGKKSEFSHLWGDIPARAFLGISESDAAQIQAIISNFLLP